jgi:hypothetical protein
MIVLHLETSAFLLTLHTPYWLFEGEISNLIHNMKP